MLKAMVTLAHNVSIPSIIKIILKMVQADGLSKRRRDDGTGDGTLHSVNGRGRSPERN